MIMANRGQELLECSLFPRFTSPKCRHHLWFTYRESWFEAIYDEWPLLKAIVYYEKPLLKAIEHAYFMLPAT